MRPRNVVIAVGLVVLAVVLLICGLMYTTDQNAADNIMEQYRDNSVDFDRNSVVTIVEQVHNRDAPEEEPESNYIPIDTSVVTDWASALESAHHVLFHAGGSYAPKGTIDINGTDVYLDCSGYMGLALYLYGAKQDMSFVTEGTLNLMDNLDNLGKLGLSDLQPGDILLYDNHVEVFMYTAGGGIAVYQWGSPSTAEDLYDHGRKDHDPAACGQSILTTSDAWKSKAPPTVYRFTSATVQNPPTPPPQPTATPTPIALPIVEPTVAVSTPEPTINIPGIPAQTPTPEPQPAPAPAPANWLECCALTHKTWGHSGFKYTYGGSATMANGDKVRLDCSGFVSYALQCYGKIAKGTMYSSGGFKSCPALVDVTSSLHSANDLQPGDIIAYSGHVEVYAGNGRVYNWGGPSSCEDKYTGCSSHDLASCTVDCTSNWYREFSTIAYVMRLQ